MANDPPRCEPPEEHRGKRWHWLSGPNINEAAYWQTSQCGWWLVYRAKTYAPGELALLGYRYLAPALPPEPKGETDAR